MFLTDKYDAPSLKDFLFPPGLEHRSPLVEYHTDPRPRNGDNTDMYCYANDPNVYCYQVENGGWRISMLDGRTWASVAAEHVTQFKCVD